MPLYDFQCESDDCWDDDEGGFCFEEYVSLADTEKRSKIRCPQCKKLALRVITNPLHYKHLSWSKWNI